MDWGDKLDLELSSDIAKTAIRLFCHKLKGIGHVVPRDSREQALALTLKTKDFETIGIFTDDSEEEYIFESDMSEEEEPPYFSSKEDSKPPEFNDYLDRQRKRNNESRSERLSRRRKVLGAGLKEAKKIASAKTSKTQSEKQSGGTDPKASGGAKQGVENAQQSKNGKEGQTLPPPNITVNKSKTLPSKPAPSTQNVANQKKRKNGENEEASNITKKIREAVNAAHNGTSTSTNRAAKSPTEQSSISQPVSASSKSTEQQASAAVPLLPLGTPGTLLDPKASAAATPAPGTSETLPLPCSRTLSNDTPGISLMQQRLIDRNTKKLDLSKTSKQDME